MDSMIRRELSARAFPGAAFLCGTADQTLYTHNYGDLDYTHTVPVTDSTLYDVASCTKVLSTTFYGAIRRFVLTTPYPAREIWRSIRISSGRILW